MQLGFQKQKTENFLQWKTQKCIYLQLLITVLKIKYEFVNGYKIVYFIYIYIYIYLSGKISTSIRQLHPY